MLELQEAPKLVEFIGKVNGKTYPNHLLYDAKKASQLIEIKQLIWRVTFAGEVLVGHLATYYETSLDAGAVVTGVHTHDWPGDYQASGFKSVGLPRMPIVTMFMCFSPDSMPARELWDPKRHRGVLSDMYKAMGAKRTFQDTVRAAIGATGLVIRLLVARTTGLGLSTHAMGRNTPK